MVEPAYIATQHYDVPHSLTPIFYRIHIERITGRRATKDREDGVSEPVEKHKPTWLDKIFHGVFYRLRRFY